jgi:hypothetical protein
MLRLFLAVLDPNEFNHPFYYRVGRNPTVARTVPVCKMGTHARFPHSAFPHANNTGLEHGGWITPPDLESILVARLIIRARYLVPSVEKALVLDHGNSPGLCGSPAANVEILDSDAFLLFCVHG